MFPFERQFPLRFGERTKGQRLRCHRVPSGWFNGENSAARLPISCDLSVRPRSRSARRCRVEVDPPAVVREQSAVLCMLEHEAKSLLRRFTPGDVLAHSEEARRDAIRIELARDLPDQRLLGAVQQDAVVVEVER